MSTTTAVDTALLRSSAKLLNVAVAAYQELQSDDLQEVVRAARDRLDAWFDTAAYSFDPSESLYQARGVLLLAEYAISASLETDGICDPVMNGLEVAAGLLQRGIKKPLDQDRAASVENAPSPEVTP